MHYTLSFSLGQAITAIESRSAGAADAVNSLQATVLPIGPRGSLLVSSLRD